MCVVGFKSRGMYTTFYNYYYIIFFNLKTFDPEVKKSTTHCDILRFKKPALDHNVAITQT